MEDKGSTPEEMRRRAKLMGAPVMRVTTGSVKRTPDPAHDLYKITQAGTINNMGINALLHECGQANDISIILAELSPENTLMTSYPDKAKREDPDCCIMTQTVQFATTYLTQTSENNIGEKYCLQLTKEFRQTLSQIKINT